MAYSEYTSPLFSDRDMGLYSPPAQRSGGYDFEYRNRAEKVIKNANGVQQADIIGRKTYHVFTGGQGIQSENMEFQVTVNTGNADRPACILAMPRIYGNHQDTALTATLRNLAGLVTNFHDISNYEYFVIAKTDGNPITCTNENIYNNKYVRQIITRNVLKLDVAEVPGFLPNVYDMFTSDSILSLTTETVQVNSFSTMSSFVSQLQLINRNVKMNAITQDFGLYEDSALTRLTALNTAWTARPNSVLRHVRVFQHQVLGNIQYNNMIGGTIATGFPIFTLDSYEQLIHYFQGEDYISDNDTNPPPDDWSTDWDIYVRGANKPNIYITMKSDKVDEWLTSDENESGISKGDITVHYRYNAVDSLDTSGKVTEKTVTFKKDKYDNTLYTAYLELIGLEFDGFVPESLDELMGMYASLEFRLEYLKFNSTWCYFSVGVIGSPSVPDFAKMKNIGGQRNYGFNDSSTVTLHYDIYPPGYDPYPTPGKPSTPGIIGGDTLPTTPTDSALGLGLLTTTYLLTPAQCDELGAFLWNFDLFEKIKALNTSPLDNIVSIKIVPYAVSGSPREIVIGNVSTSINADKVGALPLYHVGSLEYAGRYDNFLDRGGDTTAHLFLPYIGFVPIDPIWFTDKKLDVYYAFDAVTGTCRAILVVDRIAVANYTSVCGIDIPLSMGSRAQQESAYVGASLGIMLAAAGAPVAGLAAGAGAVASIVQGDNKNQRTGGVSPITAQYETRMCYIVIESVDANYARSMGHDKGFPCNATYTLSQLKGYTQVVDTVDLSSIANTTDQEKEEIRRLLVEGVYL